MPHIHPDKNDFIVDIYIVHKDKLLLRYHDKYKLWCVPGGHVELDEDPNQAAIREAKEEVGLDVKLVSRDFMPMKEKGYQELVPPRFSNIHQINDHHNHISLAYFAVSDTNNVRPSGEDKSDIWAWVTKEGLSDSKYNLKSYVKKYGEAALEELTYRSSSAWL